MARAVGADLMLTPEIRAVGFAEAEERLRGIANAIPRLTFQSVRAGSLVMERAVKRQITSQFGGGKDWRASWTSSAAIVGNQVMGLVGSAHPASRIQELGGTVVPKKARALTIPLSVDARRHRARDYTDAFVLKVNGKAFLVRSKGQRGRGGLEFLYVLAKSATLKPTHYLTKAKDKVEPEVVALVGGRISLAISTGGSA